MKRNSIIISMVLLLIPVMMGAQVLKGSYFMENSVNRTKMNPAFTPGYDYMQLPGIGNLGTGVYSNLDMSTFLFPRESGKTMTAFHPDVTLEQFSKALPTHPYLDAEFQTNLLSFGFYTKRNSYWTFDLGVKANLDVDLPHDLFTFLKKGTGTENASYNIANINLYASAAIQASLGYSKDMSFLLKGLRIGARARFIAPLAYAGVNLENVRLSTSQEKWTIDTEGYVNTAMLGLQLPKASELSSLDEFAGKINFDPNTMVNNGVLAGKGYSFDFGVSYVLSVGSIFDGTNISVSFTDLGQIIYDQNAVNSYSTKGQFNWEGINGIGLETDFEGVPDELMKDLEGLIALQDGNTEKLTTSTMPSFYAGLEMPVPYVNFMSFGFLYSARKSLSYTRHELTASYNLKPCNWFALSANYSFLNTAKTLGFLIEFTPKVGPALTLGTDYFFLETAKAPFVPMLEMLPTSFRFNINFGLAFNLGAAQLKDRD